MRSVKNVVAGLACACAAAAIVVTVQAQGFKRTPVQQGDLTIPGREVVQAMAEFGPGSESGRHTHPGDEIAYVAEGTITVEIDGKPAVTKKAGEGLIIPAGTIHNAKNTSQAGAKVLATYVIEKGKPVATPVK